MGPRRGAEAAGADDWVRVPLQMPEAVLHDSSYTGAGQAVTDRFDTWTGYSCGFQGEGNHALTFTLSGPGREQLPPPRPPVASAPPGGHSTPFARPLRAASARLVRTLLYARAVWVGGCNRPALATFARIRSREQCDRGAAARPVRLQSVAQL